MAVTAAVTAAVVGGVEVGKRFLKWNNQNYRFNKELSQERDFQIMEMRLKKFEMYREDIRDLVELTTQKMDRYLIVNTLQMGFCVTLLTEGRPGYSSDLNSQPPWLLHIQSLCLVGALMYYLLSVWLAIHASIAAHAFGVCTLTNILRLPLPSELMLDKATGLVKDFDWSSTLRIPFGATEWLNSFCGAANSFRRDESRQVSANTGASPSSAVSTRVDAGDAQVSATQAIVPTSSTRPGGGDVELPEMIQHSGACGKEKKKTQEPSGSKDADHLILFRELQNKLGNWPQYDAYARVSMAIGTVQLTHALCYSIIGSLVCESSMNFPALICTVVLSAIGWVLVKLDLQEDQMDPNQSMKQCIAHVVAALLFIPSFLVFASVVCLKIPWQKEECWMQDLWTCLMPCSYVLHIISMILAMRFASPDDGQTWTVLGGSGNNGIEVSKDAGINSANEEPRLEAGSVVREVQKSGDRLEYEKMSGNGPDRGWVNIDQLSKNDGTRRRVCCGCCRRSQSQYHWIRVEGLPEYEGEDCDLQVPENFSFESASSEEMKNLIAKDINRHCIGFFYRPRACAGKDGQCIGKCVPKKFSTGFKPFATTTYFQKRLSQGEFWEWHYISERATATRSSHLPKYFRSINTTNILDEVVEYHIDAAARAMSSHQREQREQTSLDEETRKEKRKTYVRYANQLEEDLKLWSGSDKDSPINFLPDAEKKKLEELKKGFEDLCRKVQQQEPQQGTEPELQAETRPIVWLGPFQAPFQYYYNASSQLKSVVAANVSELREALGEGVIVRESNYEICQELLHSLRREAAGLYGIVDVSDPQDIGNENGLSKPQDQRDSIVAIITGGVSREGDVPWKTVKSASNCLLCVWVLGLLWIVLFSVPTICYRHAACLKKPSRESFVSPLVGELTSPELVFDGPWPHGFFQLEGLACHASFGNTLFLAERYAVHTLELSQASLELRESLADCIAAVPEVQGRGFAGVSLDCLGSDGECSLVVLSSTGHNGIMCPFQRAEATHGLHLKFHGDQWKDLAQAGSKSLVWMLGNNGFVELGGQPNGKGEPVEFMPRVDYPVVPNVSAIAALNDRFLLGLEATGVLHAWPQHGGTSSTWHIVDTDANVRWHGLCATSTSLFLGGTRHKDNSIGIWRFDLPASLSQKSFPRQREVVQRRK